MNSTVNHAYCRSQSGPFECKTEFHGKSRGPELFSGVNGQPVMRDTAKPHVIMSVP